MRTGLERCHRFIASWCGKVETRQLGEAPMKKKGPPLGIGGPRRRVSIAGVVFTPARGVIHPSFPLRGRWERSVKSDKQAPSPSLAALHISSFETRPRIPLMHGCRQYPIRLKINKCFIMLILKFAQLPQVGPNPHFKFKSEPAPV